MSCQVPSDLEINCAPTASENRRQSIKFHPDRNYGCPEMATRAFQKVGNCEYDNRGKFIPPGARPPPPRYEDYTQPQSKPKPMFLGMGLGINALIAAIIAIIIIVFLVRNTFENVPPYYKTSFVSRR